MTFKKLLLILSFVVIAIICVLLGTSYAWYTFTDATTSFNVETMSENVDLAVVFTNDSNISTTVGIPITSEQVDEYASKTTFSITPSSTVIGSRQVAYQIEIADFSIASELKNSSYFKYSLLETVDGTTKTISSGNFSGATGSTFVLKSMSTLNSSDLDKTHSFEFRIWLEESNEAQNDLMGKRISGKIKVSTAIK